MIIVFMILFWFSLIYSYFMLFSKIKNFSFSIRLRIYIIFILFSFGITIILFSLSSYFIKEELLIILGYLIFSISSLSSSYFLRKYFNKYNNKDNKDNKNKNLVRKNEKK
jgi:hypothetical protein